MDQEGQISIKFEQSLMLPQTIDQKYWDVLLVVEVQSISDGSIYKGLFYNSRRRAL